jgi:hypothetical protein
MALAGWRAFALPAAYGTKKSPAPSFVVFERWGSMLRAGMGFGLPSACFGGDSVRGQRRRCGLRRAQPFDSAQGRLFENHEGGTLAYLSG